jgi:hypothetical protein
MGTRSLTRVIPRQEGIAYDTLVAEIIGDELHKVAWRVNGMTSSPTTSKHVNYVAKELNLKLIK